MGKKAAAGNGQPKKERKSRGSMFLVVCLDKERAGGFEENPAGSTLQVKSDPLASSEACDRWMAENGLDGNAYGIMQLKSPKHAKDGRFFVPCTVATKEVRSFG